MGKVKAMAMDLEENFIDTCANLIEDNMKFSDYCQVAITHMDMVKHLSDEVIADIIRDVWYEVTSWNLLS